ncbi:hypothetical protein GCM10017744_092350 [Streptomyces antimycoticus]|uniref:Uncharacterized protein n=1 Tax=Streptomyces antimycoticus TaxID=68175 RepID=A0A4D4JS44_9ACTN|nr:hypothetical protein SANT12839_004330 [Streptomyces antimycoticus]
MIILWGSPDGLKSAVRVPETDGSHVSWALDPILEEQLVAGDFDGDGHADLVFGLGSNMGLLKGPSNATEPRRAPARCPHRAGPQKTSTPRTTAASSPGTWTGTVPTS